MRNWIHVQNQLTIQHGTSQRFAWVLVVGKEESAKQTILIMAVDLRYGFSHER